MNEQLNYLECPKILVHQQGLVVQLGLVHREFLLFWMKHIIIKLIQKHVHLYRYLATSIWICSVSNRRLPCNPCGPGCPAIPGGPEININHYSWSNLSIYPKYVLFIHTWWATNSGNTDLRLSILVWIWFRIWHIRRSFLWIHTGISHTCIVARSIWRRRSFFTALCLWCSCSCNSRLYGMGLLTAITSVGLYYWFDWLWWLNQNLALGFVTFHLPIFTYTIGTTINASFEFLRWTIAFCFIFTSERCWRSKSKYRLNTIQTITSESNKCYQLLLHFCLHCHNHNRLHRRTAHHVVLKLNIICIITSTSTSNSSSWNKCIELIYVFFLIRLEMLLRNFKSS